MKKCVHVVYEGRVQGVGFRFTAQRIAADLNVSGWVKNMPDGSVEVVAEGDKKGLDIFLAEVKRALSRYISQDKSTWQEYTGEFKSFAIRF
jgi:acylphosphatase